MFDGRKSNKKTVLVWHIQLYFAVLRYTTKHRLSNHIYIINALKLGTPVSLSWFRRCIIENRNTNRGRLLAFITDNRMSLNTLWSRQNGRRFADDIFKCILLYGNFRSIFWLNYHWNLFSMVKLAINQHLFREWLDAKQASSHYIDQWWSCLPTHICVTWLQWVISFIYWIFIVIWCDIVTHKYDVVKQYHIPIRNKIR